MSRKKYPRLKDFSLIGEKIRKIRGGLTQQTFGKLFGVNQNTISRWEKGEALSDLETLKKVANYGGVTVEWLLKGEGATAPAQTAEHAPETYEARPVELDVDALARIINAARAYLQRHHQLLSDRAEAQLTADLYYYWADLKKIPDDQVIKHYISLAKRADLKKEG